MSDVLREYLLALGWKINESSWNKFNAAVTRTGRNVAELGGEALATGLAIAAMVERIARHYEELHYVSQRTQSSVSNIKAYGFAAKQVGLSTEGMTAAIEAFAQQQRLNPGIAGLVKQFTSASDRAEQLVDVVDGLKKRFGERGYFAAARMAGDLFGMDEPTFRMLWMNLDRLKQAAVRQKQLMKEAGIDPNEAAAKFTDFTRQMNEFSERWGVLGQRIALDFLPYVSAAVKGLDDLLAAFTRFNSEDTEGRAGMVAAIATGGVGAYVAKRILGRVLGGAAAATAGGGAAVAGAGAGAGAGTGAAVAGTAAGTLLVATGLTAGVILLASTKTANRGEKDLYRFNPSSGQYEPTDELRRQQGGEGRGGAAPARTSLSAADRDLLARTVVGEAANQSDLGQIAVAAVVLNRLKKGGYGKTVEDVVMAPKQFEPWATRRDELAGMSPGEARYRRAAANIDKLLRGEVADPTGGAVNFANVDTVAGRGNRSGMAWINDMLRNGTAIKIGDHTFGSPDSKPGATPAPFIGRASADLAPPGLGAGNISFTQHTEIKVEQGPTALSTAQGVLDGQGRVNGDAVRNLGAKIR